MPNTSPAWVRQVQVVVNVENVPIVPEPASEYALDTYGTYSGSSSTLQDLFNRTVPSDRIGVLESIEFSTDNYDVATWYVEVKGVVILNNEKLPESFTKEFPTLHLAATEQVLVQVKSDGATTINAYADVSYKEVG